jgi:hypothetical protein
MNQISDLFGLVGSGGLVRRKLSAALAINSTREFELQKGPYYLGLTPGKALHQSIKNQVP